MFRGSETQLQVTENSNGIARVLGVNISLSVDMANQEIILNGSAYLFQPHLMASSVKDKA